MSTNEVFEKILELLVRINKRMEDRIEKQLRRQLNRINLEQILRTELNNALYSGRFAAFLREIMENQQERVIAALAREYMEDNTIVTVYTAAGAVEGTIESVGTDYLEVLETRGTTAIVNLDNTLAIQPS